MAAFAQKRSAVLWTAFFVPLCAAAIAVAFPIWSSGFLIWEDSAYVLGNSAVARGLTSPAIRAALLTAPEANWMPATWLAMAAQTQLLGPPPQAIAFRITSLLLHGLAGVLLWLLLLRASGSKSTPGIAWSAAIGAAAFILHPQRVECVAWISSQKDLLATLWFLAAALCYSRSLKSGAISPFPLSWHILAAVFFTASLLSKPSAASAPLLIVLLEWARGCSWQSSLKRALPFFALSIIVIVVAWQFNTSQEMLFDPGSLSPLDRIARAFAIVSHHLATFVWPVGLAPELVQPKPALPWVVSGILLVTMTSASVFLSSRRLRPVTVPLFAWLILLIPVSGILPSPMVFTSDRMHHLPSLALSFAIAALIRQFVIRNHKRRLTRQTTIGIVSALLLLGILTLRTRDQTSVWKDDEALFRHTIALYPEHALARVNLGVLALNQGDRTSAEQEFIHATRGDRPLFSALHNLLILQRQNGNLPAALNTAQSLTDTFARRAESWYILGTLHLEDNDPQSALEAFQRADTLRPDSLKILTAIHQSLLQLGRLIEAEAILSRIPLHLRPPQH